VGFEEVRFSRKRSFGIDDCAVMPLFTPDLIDLMRRLIPPERHDCVATSVIVTGRRP
jgi:arsenite methyltransferase